MWTAVKACLSIMIAASMTLVSCVKYQARTPRNPDWAQPVHANGVPNLHQIDQNLYRSAKPGEVAADELQQLGIRTVISLRAGNGSEEGIEHPSIRNVDIPIRAWNPGDEAAEQFMAIVSDKSNGPYLVHCYHGADRTGTMVAIYRVRAHGWSTDEAIDEMLHGGYGFHKIWQNLIRWTERVAVEN